MLKNLFERCISKLGQFSTASDAPKDIERVKRHENKNDEKRVYGRGGYLDD